MAEKELFEFLKSKLFPVQALKSFVNEVIEIILDVKVRDVADDQTHRFHWIQPNLIVNVTILVVVLSILTFLQPFIIEIELV